MSDDPMNLRLHADGPVLEFPEDTWRDDPEEMADWLGVIRNAVGYQNPWALLAMRPDGDVWVFGCTHEGIFECARWGTRVRLMFAEGESWEDWEMPERSKADAF